MNCSSLNCGICSGSTYIPLWAQNPDTDPYPIESMDNIGLQCGRANMATVTWENMAKSVRQCFPRSEIQSTAIGFLNLSNWQVDPADSYHLKDIYLSLIKFMSSPILYDFISVMIKNSHLLRKECTSSNPCDQPQFAQQIRRLMIKDQVESGYTHPIEKVLEDALITDEDSLRYWIDSLLNAGEYSFVAQVLTCFGRVTEMRRPDWAFNIIGMALKHSDIRVRDAAVQILEAWGTPRVLEILVQHNESVPWLKEYIEQIIDQLNHC